MQELRERLQPGLADRYRLEREVGRGGMATVLLARDLRYDRPVALKVLAAELARSVGPERFRREIRLAARLQHPHILTVLDSGETAGHLWFTMPYVDGESLRDRLRRERQLPIDDALRIATDAARALEHAHERGVIHRDVKPENLLLTRDGSTLVADFGIAGALGGGGEPGLTETGLSVGTPAYMSPEQAAGQRDLDARSDVYALGAVLYEMLAGELPYTGPTAAALAAKRLLGEVPRVRLVRPSVPEHLERALLRALAPLPADRFATMADFARSLTAPGTPPTSRMPAPAGSGPRPARRRVWGFIAAVAIVLMGGLSIALGRRGASSAPDAPGQQRLAVLPFENLGPSDEAYFADGLTDAIRGKLAALPELQVTARSSSNLYRNTGKTPEQIGRELGVRYLLTGTVRWQKGEAGANRVQVSPELVKVASASTEWQQPFDAELSDVFAVQAEIAGRVAGALNVALGEGDRRTLARRPTADLAAYDAYLRGEQISGGVSVFEPGAVRRAVAHYQEAVTLDSTFDAAWGQLARAHALLYYNVTPSAVDAEAARSAAARALALAPDGAAGRLALGEYYTSVERDDRRALEQYALGLRAAPRNAELLAGYARAQQGIGAWDSALATLTRAREVDPRSTSIGWRRAQTLLNLRRYDEALAAIDEALVLAPSYLTLLQQKAMVYLARGDLPGAREVLRTAPSGVSPSTLAAFMAMYWDLFWVLDDAQRALLVRLTPRSFEDNRAAWALALSQTHALQGDSARSRRYADTAAMVLREHLRQAPGDGQLHVLNGLALAYLGRKAEAVGAGERGAALFPISRDAYNGPYFQHQLVRIYLLVGEVDQALDRLEPLLKIPYYLSPGWLRIDPAFAPLRGHPRFERLVVRSR